MSVSIVGQFEVVDINENYSPAVPTGASCFLGLREMFEQQSSVRQLMPEHILTSWHQHLAFSRQIVDQAEQQFIVQARRAGWPAKRTAISLGLPPDLPLEDYEQNLADRMRRMSPNADIRSWTGFDWPTE